MEKDVLIKEIMWEYNYTQQKATDIVDMYIKLGKYNDLCELVIAKRNLSMVV